MPTAKSKSGKIIRTVRQQSELLPEETMRFLQGITEDYAKVKRYVYSHYSGIGSIEKLYPGYDVQNEMNASGLRQELNLPYSYYGQAMFEALGGIKSQWSKLKKKITALVKQNQNLTDDERHYIFTILKRDAIYAAVLIRREIERPKAFEQTDLDYKKLHNLICRLTRRYMHKPGQSVGSGYFRTDKTSYRYKNGCMTLTSRTPYQRVAIPVKYWGDYTKQITVRLLENNVELIIPMETKPKPHADYTNKVALFFGYIAMLTASSGNEYGDKLGTLISARTERIYNKRKVRGSYYGAVRKSIEAGDWRLAEKIRRNNLGTVKMKTQNDREMAV